MPQNLYPSSDDIWLRFANKVKDNKLASLEIVFKGQFHQVLTQSFFYNFIAKYELPEENFRALRSRLLESDAMQGPSDFLEYVTKLSEVSRVPMKEVISFSHDFMIKFSAWYSDHMNELYNELSGFLSAKDAEKEIGLQPIIVMVKNLKFFRELVSLRLKHPEDFDGSHATYQRIQINAGDMLIALEKFLPTFAGNFVVRPPAQPGLFQPTISTSYGDPGSLFQPPIVFITAAKNPPGDFDNLSGFSMMALLLLLIYAFRYFLCDKKTKNLPGKRLPNSTANPRRIEKPMTEYKPQKKLGKKNPDQDDDRLTQQQVNKYHDDIAGIKKAIDLYKANQFKAITVQKSYHGKLKKDINNYNQNIKACNASLKAINKALPAVESKLVQFSDSAAQAEGKSIGVTEKRDLEACFKTMKTHVSILNEKKNPMLELKQAIDDQVETLTPQTLQP